MNKQKQVDPKQVTCITVLLKLFYEGTKERVTLSTIDGKDHSGEVHLVNEGLVFFKKKGFDTFTLLPAGNIVSVSGIDLKT